MAGKVTIDLDALVPKRDEEREVTLGGRKFNVSDVPVGVAAAYLRVRVDPTYTISDAMLDAAVSMLNQSLVDGDKIDKAWLLSVIDGASFEAVIDVILSPFFEGKETVRNAMRKTPDKNQKTL